MSKEHPVLIIHTAPFCGACKQFLQPNNMAKLTKLVKELNPNAEIKIVSNENWSNTNKTDDVPTVNYIPAFPMLMLTTSSNCNRRGNMNDVMILNHYWNGSQIIPVKNTELESIESFLRRNMSIISSRISKIEQQYQHVDNSMENKIKRKERTFRLIGVNE